MGAGGNVPGRVQSWLLVLILLGFPGVFAAGFGATQDPQQALLLMALYGIVVVVTGFLKSVWEVLAKRWSERMADQIDHAVVSFFSKFRGRYLQYLVFKHRTFDVKGLSTHGPHSLELKDVFVQLSVKSGLGSANPVALENELGAGSHSIWEYLRSTRVQNLVVIGPPGSGKTTLLKHMALTLAARRSARRKMNAPNLLPVFLFLREHAQTIHENPSLPLSEAVARGLANPELQPPAGWFEARLNAGKCLIMLDGLDEVADPKTRLAVVKWVDEQMAVYNLCRFVVTSRPFGYKNNPLNGVMVLEVRPFSSDQIDKFVRHWYHANEVMSRQKDDEGVRMAASEGAGDLLRRIRGASSLMTLAGNPLLLTMIATVHRYRSVLPGRRVELYAEICEVFLGKRQQARGMELDLTPAQKQRVLQPLAFAMMQRETRAISLTDALAIVEAPLRAVSPGVAGEAFLKNVENGSGLLLERESGVYSFAHLTFQEYLAAVHILEQQAEHQLTERVSAGWWHETIRLYCARADATPIIESCLQSDPLSVAALTLAVECRDEALQMQPGARARLDDVGGSRAGERRRGSAAAAQPETAERNDRSRRRSDHPRRIPALRGRTAGAGP